MEKRFPRHIQTLQFERIRIFHQHSSGLIHKIKNLTALLQARIEYIRSGGSAVPQELQGIYAFLGRGERGTKTVTQVILSVAAVLAGALLIEWLFVLYTAAARRRITSSVPSGWVAKIGALSMRSLLDFTAIIIFIIAAVILFFLFLDRTAGQRVLLAAYLAGLVFVQGAYLVLRFFLAPRASTLRILPFSDQTALYLHHWLMGLIFVICLGNMTTGVIRLAGATELTHIKAWFIEQMQELGLYISIPRSEKETDHNFGFPHASALRSGPWNLADLARTLKCVRSSRKRPSCRCRRPGHARPIRASRLCATPTRRGIRRQ